MKKIIIISIFVLGMIIPNINVKAVDVSNEEELRNAIEQGGDITLTKDIEITQPLVIDKDVNISGYRDILMQGDNTLMTVNSGNVTLDVDLYAGWNGAYYDGAYPEAGVIKDQGTALVVNGGNVNFVDSRIYAGKLGIEINGGNVILSNHLSIYAGKETDIGYSGGKGIIVNNGKVELLDGLKLFSGGTALTVSDDSAVILTESICGTNSLYSYESNGIEVNNGAKINIYGENEIFGSSNSIYLNGGTANLNGKISLGSSTGGKGIYINKGVNTATGKDVLNLGKDFIFNYGYTPNFNVYLNPYIKKT